MGEGERSDDTRRFFEDIMTMLGEVPVETVVAKVRAQVGDDEASVRDLMGQVAFWVQSARQGETEDQRIHDALGLIIALSGWSPQRMDAIEGA